MNTFYNDLAAYKIKNKLSYNDLAKIVDKNGDTFRKSVEKQRLSRLEIEALQEAMDPKKGTLDEVVNDIVDKKLQPFIKKLENIDKKNILSELYVKGKIAKDDYLKELSDLGYTPETYATILNEFKVTIAIP